MKQTNKIVMEVI